MAAEQSMTTQKQIAQRLGVSVSLVSRALSGTAGGIGVPEATVRRIHRTAERMGYTPNVTARILQGGQARTLGVVVYDFADPYFGPMIGALQRLAHEAQYSLVLGGFENRKAWNLDVAGLLKHHIDGLIIIGSGRDTGWTKRFREKNMPVVRLGTGTVLRGAKTVSVDERKAMVLIVRHLTTLGHRRLAFIGLDLPVHRQRGEALRRALTGTGASLSPRHMVYRPERLLEAGYAAACDLSLEGHLAPTAIVASNDVIALGLLRGLAERGVCVPRDISLTGYDDIPLSRLSVPALTTVRQPVEAMASAAFTHMLNKVQGASETCGEEIVLEPELVERESTGPK